MSPITVGVVCGGIGFICAILQSIYVKLCEIAKSLAQVGRLSDAAGSKTSSVDPEPER